MSDSKKMPAWGLVLLTVAGLGLVALFQEPLSRWFTPLTASLPGFQEGDEPAEAIATGLEQAFAAYEQLGQTLAQDDLDGLRQRSGALIEALASVAPSHDTQNNATAEALETAGSAAREIASATSLEEARTGYSKLSEALVSVAATEPALTRDLHLFECPMADSYGLWFQSAEQRANPYMGQRMLTCGVNAEWPTAGLAGSTDDARGEVAYYTCSMHPSVKQPGPDTCPICGMDLTPILIQEVKSGVFVVDPVRRQSYGVTTSAVERVPFRPTVRALATVNFDHSRVDEVTIRVQGWVKTLRVSQEGVNVRRRQPLFSLYSPELLTAQSELQQSIRRRADDNDPLVIASRERLQLLGLTGAQVDDIASRSRPLERVPFLAPTAGTIIDVGVTRGQKVEPGTMLYRIADLSEVWVEAEVYETDLPLISIGQRATVRLPSLPDKAWTGDVGAIQRWLTSDSRTATVRIVLPNPDGTLTPGAAARVQFESDLGKRLAVPRDAVVYAGPRRLVFVDQGEGRLVPREVQIGQSAGEWVEIVAGVEAGDEVVSSATFLIASESRLRSAARFWGADADQGEGTHEHD